MISSIEITRFRGIREGKLEDLTPLVVLVGPNGCGKSTILDALLIAANSDPTQAVNFALKRHKGLSRAARWFFWRAEADAKTQVGIMFRDRKSRSLRIQLLSDNELQCESIPRQSRRKQQGDSAVLLAIPEVRLIDSRVVDSQPPLHEFYTQTVIEGRRDKATAMVRDVVPGVEHIEILTEANEPIIHLVFPDHSVPVAVAGDGIHALVRMILELASRDHGVVLIEEPEVHQHPGAIRESARAIWAAVR